MTDKEFTALLKRAGCDEATIALARRRVELVALQADFAKARGGDPKTLPVPSLEVQ